jgi:hypothetical protein
MFYEIVRQTAGILILKMGNGEVATVWVILQAVSSPESLHPRPEYDQ